MSQITGLDRSLVNDHGSRVVIGLIEKGSNIRLRFVIDIEPDRTGLLIGENERSIAVILLRRLFAFEADEGAFDRRTKGSNLKIGGRIGWDRAARIVDALFDDGIVTQPAGTAGENPSGSGDATENTTASSIAIGHEFE